ncbi:Polyhydroxyalkonate synthesis repressor, PhaR [Beijerinckiaceae bacterium RH AL1]|nr:polyhydroxyalkanoate synthesis repressor PhaR [Beijerinckiaceae bacterium]VVB49000.1 Polyhydroxyalkonate synthesis repressor, PhaR [Beijerinckiaceae bacterium RH CH11]VVB49079.1 Polyhydroxyalkonate synthesis repressor, PhaR [Beijerinckiaceae bacterium RH AL8]VVC56677.1 Polyhydroxyalkonate synthesis repressor, PhaR [Beijerinckiaceae bacterium RH AL1]
MEAEKTPVTIKKYANRRLYNTGTSAYVTLEDLAAMVKKGDDFVVYDAKTGEDITRSVLTQIIFEQESKGGQGLLPITFLRQLIRFYGDSMQMMVPSYLEFSLDKLTQEKGGLAEQYSAMFAANPLASAARPFVGQIEEQTRQNMAMFRQALSMFTPFSGASSNGSARAAAPPSHPAEPPPGENGKGSEFDEMRRQIEALQRRMDDISSK